MAVAREFGDTAGRVLGGSEAGCEERDDATVEPVVGVDDDGATGRDDAKAFLEECLNGE